MWENFWGRDILSKFHYITESNGYYKGLLLYMFDKVIIYLYVYTESIGHA